MTLSVGWASMDWSQVPDPETGHPTPGGSGWYRCHLPHQALLEAGVDSVIGRLIADPHTGRFGVRTWAGDDYLDRDLLILQRWMLDGLGDDITRARSTGQLVVNDVDDWFFGLATQNRASKSLNSDPRSNLSHYRRILIVSDLIVCSTPYLARRIATFQPRCVVSRNRIDLDTPGRWPVTPQRDRPILGWAGAVPWRSGDLETLRGVVAPLLAQFDSPIAFHHSGDIGGRVPTAGEILRIPDAGRTATPMAPIADWPAQMAHFDVGIIPLSERPFNEAKCLDETTRVSTPEGLVQIGTLTEGRQVWNGSAWVGVRAVEKQPVRQGRCFVLASGRRLLLTDEHRMWALPQAAQPPERFAREVLSRSLRAEGMSMSKIAARLGVSIATVWRDIHEVATTPASVLPPKPPASIITSGWHRADALEPGHRLLLDRWQPSRTIQQERVPLLHGRRSRVGYQSDPDAPSLPIIEIDENWGELLGFFVGNGSVGDTTIKISCNGRDQDVIQRVVDLFAAIGLRSTAAAKPDHPLSWSVDTSSSTMADFLHRLGLSTDRRLSGGGISARTRTPDVPEVVWQSPLPVIRAFLRGYFETDGTTSEDHRSVSAVSKDRCLLAGVQQLLLCFGITSTLAPRQGPKEYADRTYWQLMLGALAVDLFAEQIGFIGTWKQKRLQETVGRDSSGAALPLAWEDEILAVELCSVTPVDIQVDGAAFVADGYLSHNSAIKGMEYAAAGKPFVAQTSPEYSWLAALGVGRVARRPRDWIRHLDELLTMTAAERTAEADRNRDALRSADLTTANLAEHWLEAVVGGLDPASRPTTRISR